MGRAKDNFEYLDPSKGVTRDHVYGGLLTYDLKKSDKAIYTYLQNDFMCEISEGMIIDNKIYLSSFYDPCILVCEKLN